MTFDDASVAHTIVEQVWSEFQYAKLSLMNSLNLRLVKVMSARDELFSVCGHVPLNALSKAVHRDHDRAGAAGQVEAQRRLPEPVQLGPFEVEEPEPPGRPRP